MHEQPSSWATTELGALIQSIDAGLSVKCEERPPEPGERGLVKISAVTWGHFDEMQSKTLPENVAIEERYRIKPGDLLISRANTIELVGASVIVGRIERRLYLSDKVLRLIVDEPSKRWVNYATKTPWMRKAIEDASSGNQLSMRNLTQDKLRSLQIPAAPLAEQQRIADKLDTVLARVDACRDRLARVAPLLKRFRQSVLAAATSGRLTEDWRTHQVLDSGSQSIWLGEEAVSCPKSWTVVALSELIDPARPLCYGVVQPGEACLGGIPLVRVQDMNRWSILLGDLRTISSDVDAEYRRSRVRGGDLLISVVGTIGRTAVVPIGFEGNIARAVARVAASQFANPWWLNAWLNSTSVQWWLASSSREVARKTLNLSELAGLRVALPSLPEQAEIVRRVETLFAFANRLEARLAKAQTAVDRLTPSLLAKAFRGELVPQDPNDEPAVELLKRLAAQRGAAPVRTRRSRVTPPEGAATP